MDQFYYKLSVKLIGPKNDPPTVVQEKVLSLIQCWADAFQNQPDLQCRSSFRVRMGHIVVRTSPNSVTIIRQKLTPREVITPWPPSGSTPVSWNRHKFKVMGKI
ncbi:TOM1-like protein 2 [Eumeta japonica]|uniref:TOM1-like protein 2 n=1 Tax=Eumeta variegata TaxID=151549 RepID=A0A4C1YU30_EUMVA|nr:TOM1-like protein 2 [Eumeta japonica]